MSPEISTSTNDDTLADKPSGDSPPRIPWWKIVVLGRNPRATLFRILVLVTLCYTAFHWMLFPIQITGISMEPTLHNRSIGIVNRLAYRHAAPQRGDIVSIGEYGKPNMLMKRIIALPGETYSIRHGQVFINEEPLKEPYVVHRAAWEVPPVTLGTEEYLVIGDNRGMDQHDHYFGRTDRRYIIGKLVF